MRREGLVLRLVWLELQSVELVLAAIRTGSPTGLRQQNVLLLKMFACGYRLGADSRKRTLS
jgi:hypothetical protein